MMKKELLEKAREEIRKEIDRVGYIDDSDDANRFLDNLVQELVKEDEELQEELLREIKDKIMSRYNRFSTCENGHYAACYYEIDKEFNSWDEFNDYFGLGE
jgi:hypothetical protein